MVGFFLLNGWLLFYVVIFYVYCIVLLVFLGLYVVGNYLCFIDLFVDKEVVWLCLLFLLFFLLFNFGNEILERCFEIFSVECCCKLYMLLGFVEGWV